MKLNRLTCIALAFHLISAGLAWAQPTGENEFNCFSVLVGKKASADGSVLFAHNEDDGGVQLVNYYRVPRIEHADGEVVSLDAGAVAPQVKLTYSYLWFEMPGMAFSDSYANEWGVAIASDACTSREKNGLLKDGGIGYWLRRLIAERARTAREGVKIGGALIENYGYASSGRTYVIADANEGWMLSVVNGRHWVAQRVPDDHVAVLPNYYTIGHVNLSDTMNFLGADDLIDYAIAQHWYNPDTDGAFHFARAYSSPGNLINPGNVHRMWRGVNLAAGTDYPIDAAFPFSLPPKEKLTVQDLMRVLRDHCVGTELDKTNGYKLGSPYELNPSTICANHTQYGFVAQLRSWMPVQIGAVIWLAQHRPDTQAFVPWYLGMSEPPHGYAFGDYRSALDQHFNPPSNVHDKTRPHAFWSFVTLTNKVDEHYSQAIWTVQKKWNEFEMNGFKEQGKWDIKARKVYAYHPDEVAKMLTEFSHDWAQKARATADKLKAELGK